MSKSGVYAFEAIDDTLPFLPLAARRALDALGLKLSLDGWLSLALDDRRRLVFAGAIERVETLADDLAARLRQATPAPTTIARGGDPDPNLPPTELTASLGPGRPLDAERWAALDALDRYALVKSAGKAAKLARAYDAIVALPVLSHVKSDGAAHMVDVGAKATTARRAVASARVQTTRAVIDAISAGGLPKGDALAVARVAGILASKRTSELVPLCHPVQTTGASIDFEPDAERGSLRVVAAVEAIDRTGVEMEAMVAASVASLTVYDMIKSADRWATIEGVRLETKRGGKSGDLARPDARGGPGTAPASGVPFVALQERPPSVDEAIAAVSHPGAGAVCAFLGVVRDSNEGRAVVKLEYEAYASMAVAEMKRIADELSNEIPGVRLAVVHRTGALAVGDVAVVCAASAKHRAEAYEACRALIDRVKSRVPIWKREHGPEGAWWVGWEDARCPPDHPHHDKS